MNKSKMIKSTLLATLSVWLLGSCMKTEEPEPLEPLSFISIFNGYTNDDHAMPRIAGQNLYSGEGLPYGEFSPYYYNSVSTQTYSFVNSQNQVLGDPDGITHVTEENKFYSWILYGTEEDTKHVIVEDRFMEPDPDEATSKVRFFNLSTGTEGVDLYFGEADNIEDLAFGNRPPNSEEDVKSYAGFTGKNVSSGTDIIAMSTVDEDRVKLAELKNYNFQPYYHYTIVLIGTPGDYKIVVSPPY